MLLKGSELPTLPPLTFWEDSWGVLPGRVLPQWGPLAVRPAFTVPSFTKALTFWRPLGSTTPASAPPASTPQCFPPPFSETPGKYSLVECSLGEYSFWRTPGECYTNRARLGVGTSWNHPGHEQQAHRPVTWPDQESNHVATNKAHLACQAWRPNGPRITTSPQPHTGSKK